MLLLEIQTESAAASKCPGVWAPPRLPPGLSASPPFAAPTSGGGRPTLGRGTEPSSELNPVLGKCTKEIKKGGEM